MSPMRRFAERSKQPFPDPGQKTKTKMVWSRLKAFWLSKDNPTGHSERKKRKGRTEEEVGPAQLLQLKTGQGRKGLLRIPLWGPDDIPRFWDRIDRIE